jgi:uncharacterized membrane protein
MTASTVANIQFLRRTLWVVFVISLIGLAFSGTLSYRELAGLSASCPATGAAGTILGLPACVYGLAMYAILTAVAAWGLFLHGGERPQRRRSLASQVQQ